jgi:hypothetical protein
MFCGIFTTFLIPETKRRTLEELAGEVPGTKNFDMRNVGAARAYHLKKLSSGGREGKLDVNEDGDVRRTKWHGRTFSGVTEVKEIPRRARLV